jgi:hypothetical protein
VCVRECNASVLLQAWVTPAIAFSAGYMVYSVTLALAYMAHMLVLSRTHASPDGESAPVRHEAGVSKREVPAGGTRQALSAAALRYAAITGADLPTLHVCCIFTWQACQKMLLSEATRSATIPSQGCCHHDPAMLHLLVWRIAGATA